jgi:hypothetical protein
VVRWKISIFVLAGSLRDGRHCGVMRGCLVHRSSYRQSEMARIRINVLSRVGRIAWQYAYVVDQSPIKQRGTPESGKHTRNYGPIRVHELFPSDLVGNLLSKTDRKNQTIQ